MKRICYVLVLMLMDCCGGTFADLMTAHPVISGYADSLVVLQGDTLVPFRADRFLQAPFIVLYFGAGWCPDCRRFSPSLVMAYEQQTADNKSFEVLLMSRDKSEQGMVKFMKSEKMKWPALAFAKLESAGNLQGLYSGHGIPCLTVLDRQGKVVLQSKSDQDGEEVLRELRRLIDR